MQKNHRPRAAGEGRMSRSTGGEGGNRNRYLRIEPGPQEKEGWPVPQGGRGETYIAMPI